MTFFYIAAIYFLTTLVVGCIGLAEGFQLDVSNPQFLVFQKSSMTRLFSAMMSLMCLGCIGIFANATRPADIETFWWLIAPMCVGVSYFFAYLAGPQDVRIDLESRICYQTKGWFFHPRKQTYQLTQASYLCAYCGNKSCYTMLRIGDPADTRFVLAMRGSQSAALSFAQEIADKLHLPAKVTDGPGF